MKRLNPEEGVARMQELFEQAEFMKAAQMLPDDSEDGVFFPI